MAPGTLKLDLSKYPKLTREQAGHLRHFWNTSTSLDGEWPHMGTQEPDQAFLDAFRYQLATMAYGAGVTHYHRLPAMRSLFKPLLRGLIRKMLRREVWSYWYLTSQSGNRLEPGLEKLRTPWADPVVKENIMYSGHLLLMTSLYAMLFDDDEFEKQDSLRFEWDPLFWGMGPEFFSYDNSSLQEAILKEMERNGWAGVCCEPNLIFVVCNQFPIIAMRYNDVRHGTSVVEGVLEKYWNAIQKKQMISSDGLFVDWLFLKQGNTKQAGGIGFTAWANAFMNTWNSMFIRRSYDKQALGFITKVDGKIELQHPKIGTIIRHLVQTEDVDPNAAATVQRAREKYLEDPSSRSQYTQPHFGYVIKWLSELGKAAETEALLNYADSHFSPSWDKGGLYYPRQDQITNELGEWRFVDPFTGNSAIGYARLNLEDGQKKMWEKPWTRELLAARPWVDGLDYCQGVDCLRGWWADEEQAMIITLRSWDGAEHSLNFSIQGLFKGHWGLYEYGVLLSDRRILERGELIEVSTTVRPGQEIDIVVLKLA
ncbi:hypothetical protein N7462_000285 [Penicillium macrosclerotiorum]|uniref:uncharacterized protein n=1 Tax=Penicillium macrosclerotiorum TaxID=303699 RepID=UPI002547DCB7|nr:uncharacterized protein N7462_000285 [Penicillium macrosclerotiorum]KAJ5698280.1 hypothetical protein N7462_000285 [Penicillium macrosclerotiorum]